MSNQTYESELDLVSLLNVNASVIGFDTVGEFGAKPVLKSRGRKKIEPDEDSLDESDEFSFKEKIESPAAAEADTSTDVWRGVIWWYLHEVAKHRLLSGLEEIELGRANQFGDRASREGTRVVAPARIALARLSASAGAPIPANPTRAVLWRR